MHNFEGVLWCDLDTDEERADFIRSGRAAETGIIAQAIVDDVARAFDMRAVLEEILEANSKPYSKYDINQIMRREGLSISPTKG